MVMELEREQTTSSNPDQQADAVYRLVLELVRSWPEERQAALVAEVQAVDDKQCRINEALVLLRHARRQLAEEEVIWRLTEVNTLLLGLELSNKERSRLRNAIDRADDCLEKYTLELSQVMRVTYGLVARIEKPPSRARRESVRAIGMIETREVLTDQRIEEILDEYRTERYSGRAYKRSA